MPTNKAFLFPVTEPRVSVACSVDAGVLEFMCFKAACSTYKQINNGNNYWRWRGGENGQSSSRREPKCKKNMCEIWQQLLAMAWWKNREMLQLHNGTRAKINARRQTQTPPLNHSRLHAGQSCPHTAFQPSRTWQW